jgi:hypothetical protein
MSRQHRRRGVLRAFIVNDRTVRCGKIVVVNRVPIFSLCRKLLEHGIRGSTILQTYTAQGTPSLRGIVGRMAGLTVAETDRGGVRRTAYVPFRPFL